MISVIRLVRCTFLGGMIVAAFSLTASAEVKVTLNDFYRPFSTSEITPKNMQSWPYYRYVSMNWDEYGIYGTASVRAAKNPAELTVADIPFDIQQDLRQGQTFAESLTATQTKGFLILKDDIILGEFYDNGFSREQTQLLQSSSKTYAGIIASKLIDSGKLGPNANLMAILAAEITGLPFNKLLSDLFNDFRATSNGSIALTVDGTASPSYGISCTLRDYALFHQWIAQGKAPKSFYSSIKNLDKDLLSESETGKQLAAALGTPVAYGSQGWYFPEHTIVYTAGSYGQYGFSDMESGISVVFMQDWEDNAVAEKLIDTVARALFVIEQLGSQ